MWPDCAWYRMWWWRFAYVLRLNGFTGQSILDEWSLDCLANFLNSRSWKKWWETLWYIFQSRLLNWRQDNRSDLIFLNFLLDCPVPNQSFVLQWCVLKLTIIVKFRLVSAIDYPIKWSDTMIQHLLPQTFLALLRCFSSFLSSLNERYLLYIQPELQPQLLRPPRRK